MEVSISKILDSASYRDMKEKLNKEINWGDVTGCFPDYSIFKKSDAEKTLIANMKAKWRKDIQAKGFSKRKVPSTYVISI